MGFKLADGYPRRRRKEEADPTLNHKIRHSAHLNDRAIVTILGQRGGIENR